MDSSDRMTVEEMEIRKTFFDYWDRLDNFTDLNDETTKLTKQEVRAAIIDILAIGIPDTDPMTGERRKRHVLSAKELLREVNERLEKSIKKSNLYFHLRKLQEAGLVQEVDKIPRGKNHVTFYGRTAKAFVPVDETDARATFGDEFVERELYDLTKRINPTTPDKEIIDTIDQALSKYYELSPSDLVATWLDKYQEDTLLLEIDIRNIFKLFDILNRYDPETIAAMKDLASLLDLEK